MHPLAPGTQVGAWRVLAWQGQGSYGAVYRAVRTGLEHLGPGALKLSLYPEDRRFAREALLLSLLSHPSVPRLLDRGVLLHPSGFEHPFFVMEWIEGMPLYAWAQQHAPSVPEICRVLAQLARALEALHASGAVHRDVKGDNVLVRLSDRLPVLIDFGSGHFQGASRLTWESLPPGTLAYLSPQAGLFHIRLVRQRDSYYTASPADDLYALGVTAFRLVMGQYPPDMNVQQDDEGSWQVTGPDPRPLLERNPQVPPHLREWIVRLLSDSPQERGTAAQAAEALEATVEQSAPVPQLAPPPAAEAPQVDARLPAGAGERPERPRPVARVRTWRPWLAVAAAGVAALLLWSVEPMPVRPGQVSATASAPGASDTQVPDAGTAAAGDRAPAAPEASAPPPSEQGPIAQEAPVMPRPGQPQQQLQPDAKGRCPGSTQVAFNGNCWVENPAMNAKTCVENGYVLLKGKCFAPALESPQKPVPTSSPAKAR
jgi:predicted Ser/Thr protein kinase